MTRDQVQRIAGLLTTLADELSAVVQEPPPKNIRLPTNLLDHAPRRLADLPGWFAALPRHQFDAVWCIAIIDAVTCEPYSVRDLAAALHAVRDYPRVDVAPLDAPRSVSIPEPAGDHRRVLNPASPAPTAPTTSPERPRNEPAGVSPITSPERDPGERRAITTETPPHAPHHQAKSPREEDHHDGDHNVAGSGPVAPDAQAHREAPADSGQDDRQSPAQDQPPPAEITVSAPPMDPARARKLLGTRSGTGERWLKLFGHDLIEIADSLLSPGDPAQEVTILFAPREEHMAVRYGKLLASTGRYEFLRRMGRRPPSLRRLS
jgi:hypothetical protein